MTKAKLTHYLFVSIAISAAILFALTRLTTWQDFLALWHRLRWTWTALGSLAYCAEIVLMGVRVSKLFTAERPPSAPIILISNVHNFTNKVLPARLGELASPLLMHRHVGVSGTRALPVLILAHLPGLYTVMIAFSIVNTLQRDLLSDWRFYWLPVATVWLVLLLVPTSLLGVTSASLYVLAPVREPWLMLCSIRC
jgi:hypothetical protein